MVIESVAAVDKLSSNVAVILTTSPPLTIKSLWFWLSVASGGVMSSTSILNVLFNWVDGDSVVVISTKIVKLVVPLAI